jgi:glycine cleavage system H lipoate-binding protein
MSVIIGLLFVAVVIGISLWRQRKAIPVPGEAFKAKPVPSFWKGIFVHPGHAWVEVLDPNLVAVGADEFTRSVFGSVERFRLPEPGNMIQQGGKVWSLKRGKRELVQTAPISGRVVEVNKDLLDNPRLIVERDIRKNWILKVESIGLKRQLQNLLQGNVLVRWNQAVKEQLVTVLGLAGFPVLQDGGELAPDLGEKLTDSQWEKVKEEFFH